MSTHGMVQVAQWTHRLVPLSSVQAGDTETFLYELAASLHCMLISASWRVWSSAIRAKKGAHMRSWTPLLLVPPRV